MATRANSCGYESKLHAFSNLAHLEEAMPAALKAVFFDLDDTLWDLCATMERAHAAWCAVMSEQGCEDLVQAHPHWTSWTDASPVFARIKLERPDFGGDLTLIRREALHRACAEHNVAEDLVEAGYTAWTQARNEPVLFAGVVRLLSTLKQDGIVLGAISDGFANLKEIPEIFELLDFAIFAKDVGVSKPDPELFRIAVSKTEELLHCQCTAGDCLMVGDSYQKDALGAKAVGMRSVWFDNPRSFPRSVCGQTAPTPPLECDAKIQCIEELFPILQDMSAKSR
eukprot:TRINITY_DN91562_c0_g1_i1.p1 TRINITY_DN91562_c0_g1~~TRINITY_DN91562_c0_g1_i1.p1  ORF type:complete len:283 (-),score=45.48 TRINITY_DN91562_c0_g1_i1:134-982(-)